MRQSLVTIEGIFPKILHRPFLQVNISLKVKPQGIIRCCLWETPTLSRVNFHIFLAKSDLIKFKLKAIV